MITASTMHRLAIFAASFGPLACCQPVAAAVFTWTGSAGATWNSSSANWSGGGGTLWDLVNGPLNVADFNIAGASPNISGTIYTNGITFAASGTIANGTIELSGPTPTITANANATIASVLDGTAGLTVAGSATLTLTGSNTYSGGTTINGGTLSIGSDSNLGAAPSTFTAASIALNAGTLQFTSGSVFYTPTISSSRGITLGSAGGTINVSSSASGNFSTGTNEVVVQYRGTISGAGNLAVTGGTATNSSTNPYILELGATNAYTGSTTISNAIVTFEDKVGGNGDVLGPNNILPTSTVLNLVNNGWFVMYNYVSDQTIAGLTGDATGRLASINNDTLDFVNVTIDPAAGQSYTFPGVIGAQTVLSKVGKDYLMSLVFDGSGTQILTGSNTYGGSTTISAGTLQLGNGAATGSIAGSAVTDNSVLAINRSDSVNLNSLINGSLTGSGSLLQIGPGTVIVATSSGYSGGTAINGGTLEFSITSAMPAVGTVTVASSATLAVGVGGANQFTNATSGAGSIGGLLAGTGGQGAPVVWTAGSIFGIDTTSAIGGTFTYGGNITDTNSGTTSLGLAKLGAGTLVLAGTNSYTGGTAINVGTLEFSTPSAMPAVGTITVASSATLAAAVGGANQFTNATSGAGSIGGLLAGIGGQGAPVVWTAGSILGIDTTAALGGTFTYSGNITDTNSGTTSLGLAKLGTGTLVLAGTNSYSGSTTVNGGTLSISSDSNLGAVPGTATAASITLNTGTLQLNLVSAFDTATINSNRGITLGSGGGVINVAMAASGTFSTNESALQYRGIIRGSGNLLVTGGSGVNSGRNPYILELGAQNLYTGATTVNNAIVCVANGGSSITNILRSTTVLNLVDNGWFNLNSSASNQTITGLGGDATGRVSTTNISSRVIVTIEPATGHSYNFPGVVGAQTILNRTGSNSLLALVIDGQGTQILSGVNTYSGTTSITAGTLQLGNGGSTGSIAASAVTDNGTLAVSRSDNVNLNSLISGPLTGSGGLLQNGPGALTVTTTNTFSGGTTVLGGTLILDGASSLLAGSRLVIGSGASAGAEFTSPNSRQSSLAASTELTPVPEPGTWILLMTSSLIFSQWIRSARSSK